MLGDWLSNQKFSKKEVRSFSDYNSGYIIGWLTIVEQIEINETTVLKYTEISGEKVCIERIVGARELWNVINESKDKNENNRIDIRN